MHEEAAQAIRDPVKLCEAQPDRGIFNPNLGRTVRYRPGQDPAAADAIPGRLARRLRRLDRARLDESAYAFTEPA
jgi:hypothetical protein